MHNQAIHQNHKQTGMNAILIHNNFIDLVAQEQTNNQDGNEPQQTKENAGSFNNYSQTKTYGVWNKPYGKSQIQIR